MFRQTFTQSVTFFESEDRSYKMWQWPENSVLDAICFRPLTKKLDVRIKKSVTISQLAFFENLDNQSRLGISKFVDAIDIWYYFENISPEKLNEIIGEINKIAGSIIISPQEQFSIFAKISPEHPAFIIQELKKCLQSLSTSSLKEEKIESLDDNEEMKNQDSNSRNVIIANIVEYSEEYPNIISELLNTSPHLFNSSETLKLCKIIAENPKATSNKETTEKILNHYLGLAIKEKLPDQKLPHLEEALKYALLAENKPLIKSLFLTLSKYNLEANMNELYRDPALDILNTLDFNQSSALNILLAWASMLRKQDKLLHEKNELIKKQQAQIAALEANSGDKITPPPAYKPGFCRF